VAAPDAEHGGSAPTTIDTQPTRADAPQDIPLFITGGTYNLAGGTFASSVSGGKENKATGEEASISGGGGGEASAPLASVTGGRLGKAPYRASTVLGGLEEVTEKEFGITP